MSARVLLAAWALSVAACIGPGVDDAPRSTILTARVYIEAEYDAVWERFVRAELYEDWYSAPCIEFGSAPGDAVRWGTAGKPVYRGTLRTIQEGKGITHTFQFVGFGFDEPPTPVEIEIRECGPTVLVSVRHDCNGAPHTQDMISPLGWSKSLSRLKTLLETGRPMPWPEKKGF